MFRNFAKNSRIWKIEYQNDTCTFAAQLIIKVICSK